MGLTAWRVPMSPVLGTALAVLCLTGTGFVLVGPGVGAWHAEAAGRMMRGAWQERNAPTQADLLSARTHLQAASAWDRTNPATWAELAEVSAQVAGRVWSHGIMPTGARVSDTSTLARFQAAGPVLKETRDAYRESLRLRPRAADVHERLGRFLSGVESARLAVRRDTGQAPAALGMADGRGSNESLVPEALTRFRDAVRWDPQNAYYHRSLGLFAQRYSVDQGGRDVASEALGQALALRPDFLPSIVDELLARRVDDGSLLAAMPRKSEVLLDLGRVLEERGRHRTATAAFDEAVRLAQSPSQEVEARLAYARALIARKEPLTALDQARSALVAAPREAEVFALLALIHAQMNKDGEAETALATAVSLAESGPPSRRNRLRGLAALYVQRGQWDLAMGLWREVLRERPNDGWAHFELGRMLERAGDAAGALQEYKTAAAVAGDAWDLHHVVARALRDAGYLREAVTSYETAQRINPTDVNLGAELGDLYARIGLSSGQSNSTVTCCSGNPITRAPGVAWSTSGRSPRARELSMGGTNGLLSIETTAQQFAQKLAESLPVTIASVALWDRPSFSLTIKGIGTARPLGVPLPLSSRLSLATSPTHRAAFERQEPIYLDLESMGSAGAQDEVSQALIPDLRAMYLLPIRVGDETVGILGLGEMRSNTREPLSFEKRERCRAILEEFVESFTHTWETGRLRQQVRAMGSLLRMVRETLDARTSDDALAMCASEVGGWLGAPVRAWPQQRHGQIGKFETTADRIFHARQRRARAQTCGRRIERRQPRSTNLFNYPHPDASHRTRTRPARFRCPTDLK